MENDSAHPGNISIPDALLGVISCFSARTHRVLPVAYDGDIVVVVSDVAATPEREQLLAFCLGRPVRIAGPVAFPDHRRHFQTLLDRYAGSATLPDCCSPCTCLPEE
jgi:hypothetical protein